MGITQRLKNAIAGFQLKTVSIPPGVEVALGANGKPVSFFMPISWGSKTTATKSTTDLVNAYNKCAPVASIINKKVKAHLNRKLYVVDDEGNEMKGSTASTFLKLISRPNVIQDGRRFEQQAKIYLQLFGSVFIYAPRAIPSNPMSVKSMWVIPNWMIEPVFTGKFYNQIDLKEIISHYDMNVGGMSTRIEMEDIIYIKDIQINTDNQLAGASRLWSLTDQVNTIIAAYEANSELIVNHGAMGIISPPSAADVTGKALGWTPKEQDAVQAGFSDRYGIRKSMFKYIITNASLQFQAITMPIKDLMLMESISESIRQIAESYDMPKMLLGFDKGTTYSNLNEAKLSLYQDAIIPEADDYCAAFTDHFQLDKQGLFYKAYYDHLEIFQRSKLDEANSLKAFNEAKAIEFNAGIITADEWKEAINTFTT